MKVCSEHENIYNAVDLLRLQVFDATTLFAYKAGLSTEQTCKHSDRAEEVAPVSNSFDPQL